MSRGSGRTSDCDSAQAVQRLADARAHMTHADLADPASPPADRKAAATAAVSAGIAAADAACCTALGMHSTSPEHFDAVDLVRQVEPGGPEAAKKLNRLLGYKHAANYGLGPLSSKTLTDVQRWARGLVEFAERIVAR